MILANMVINWAKKFGQKLASMGNVFYSIWDYFFQNTDFGKKKNRKGKFLSRISKQ